MTQGIYEIVNWQDGKATSYIGSSLNIERRWGEHRRALRRGRHENAHLQNAWDKYGEAAFAFSMLEEVGTDMLLAMEQEYLDDYFDRGQCYNIAQEAAAPFSGRNHTDEARRKIAEASKSRRHTPETRCKMSEVRKGRMPWNKGKHLSEEHKRKIGEASKGRRHTDEARRKICEGMTGKQNALGNKHSEETKRKMSKAQMDRKRQPLSEEHKRKLSEANKGNQNALGHRQTEEHKRKLSEANKGKVLSEEHKRKIRESNKQWWVNYKAKLSKDSLAVSSGC